MRQITIGDFLTEDEIEQCAKLWQTDRQNFHKNVLAILEPQMERINKALGQENDAGYLAYAIEFIMGQASQ